MAYIAIFMHDGSLHVSIIKYPDIQLSALTTGIVHFYNDNLGYTDMHVQQQMCQVCNNPVHMCHHLLCSRSTSVTSQSGFS